MNTYINIGKPEKRIDALEKVTGSAQYFDDIRIPGMLYAKIKRSEFSHANILNIDTSDAEKLLGVKAVITGKEFTANFKNSFFGTPMADQPFLAIEKVRYVGEPIAVVAATSEEIAEDALDLIKIEYQVLPTVLNVQDALKNNAPLIHENTNNYRYPSTLKPAFNNNICSHIEIINGDIEQGFKEADFIFEDTFTDHCSHHVPIECRGTIAKFNPNGSITVWAPDQSPYGGRNLIAGALKIPESKVRIITPSYIGGGFGGKLRLSGLMPVIAIAWKTNYQPVKLLLTREEEFISTTVRHAAVITLKTGVKKDGTIVSRHAKVMIDTGAYADRGPTVLGKISYSCIGPYKIPHAKVEAYCVYTNKAIGGAWRGFGTAQACWAYESQMDIIAKKLGIDSVDIRLKNIVDEGYITPTEKQEAHAVGLGECLVKSMEDISQKREEILRANTKKGKGIACGYKISATPSGCNAFVKLNSDLGADILVSSVEMGQGVNTIFAQIVAEELTIPFDNIRVVPADTDITPFLPAVVASRTTFFLGNAVKEAALDIKKQLFNLAKDILKSGEQELSLKQGLIFSRKDPRKTIKISEIMEKTNPGGISFLGRGTYYHYKKENLPSHIKVKIPPTLVWMYGSQGITVDVDTETGRIKILKVSAANDTGKTINPITCEGQIEGGVMMGIGHAIFEELIFNEQGKIINTSMLDYKIPSALDMPEINSILVEEPHREGPYGAKGIGEIVTVPTAAAIANAIYDAVGIRIKDLPITPDKLLRALKNKV
jgi:CO/xanthine dehydrogenase Mo-binding subunit